MADAEQSGTRPRSWARDRDESILPGEIALPGGVARAATGMRLRRAALRALTGEDELWMATTARGLGTGERVGMLLQRLLMRLGDCSAPTLEQVYALPVGDLDYLALCVCRQNLGAALELIAPCTACHETFELRIEVDAVPLHAGQPLEDPFVVDCEGTSVCVRLPIGRDRLALEPRPRRGGSTVADRSEALRDRCIVAIEGVAVDADRPADLPNEALARIESEIARRSPSLPTLVDGRCPECGHDCALDFDPARILFGSFEASVDRLYREIHALAWTYHWSQAEILGLPRDARRRYLALIQEEVEGD